MEAYQRNENDIINLLADHLNVPLEMAVEYHFENFVGVYASKAAFTMEYYFNVNSNEIEALPRPLMDAIDWVDVSSYLFNESFFAIELRGVLHVFWNH